MKRRAKAAEKRTVALALTWDGARWPVRKLPSSARAFLTGRARNSAVPTSLELTKLLTRDEIRELRICWVPRLKGGAEVLAEPFAVPGSRRLAFAAAKVQPLGDCLGVVYRKTISL